MTPPIKATTAHSAEAATAGRHRCVFNELRYKPAVSSAMSASSSTAGS